MRLLFRSLLSILIGLCLTWPCAAQDPNPQSSFATTESLAGPSLELNFNDQTTAFLDQISGQSFTSTASNSIPTDIGWWQLGEGSGSTAYDSSATAANGAWTVASSCSGGNYAAGDFSTYSACFNGSWTYVSTPYNSKLRNPYPITIGAWIYPTNTLSTAGWEGVVSNPYRTTSWAAPYYSYGLALYQGTPRMFVTVAGVMGECDSPVAAAANQWSLILGAYDGSDLKVYLNGTLEATCPLTGAIDYSGGNTGVVIGTDSQYFSEDKFVGRISNAFVLNASLTQAQITSMVSVTSETQLASIMTTTVAYTSGTITPRQPGFDSTLANNTSAEFPYNGWSAAPNNTLGAIEWNTPWTMMVQVDRLNWNQTGTLVLASKGDLASGNYWQLYLQMTANTTSGANGQVSQLCFARHGSTAAFDTWGGGVGSSVCTSPTYDAMPNGYNYNIVVEDSGTGSSGASGYGAGTLPAINLYINGLGPTYMMQVGTSQSFGYGFGAVSISISGGTGYANSTAFTSTGGGANCVVAGSFNSSGGVPTSGAVYFTWDFGCTSTPTIVLTSPTGTGATISVTPVATSMNSTSYPVMVPGYVSGAAYYGVAASTGMQTPTYIDEFAIFPTYLNQTQIQDLFYWTKFYQGLLNPVPAVKPAFLFDDDYPDEDNVIALQVAIAEHKLGYIQLEGVVAETDYDGQSSTGANGAALFRQALDQAGLSDVPVGIGGPTPAGGLGATIYNASTPNTSTAYPSASSIYQEVMAKNSTTPVDILLGGAFDGAYSFLQSSGGQTLWNLDAANGGAVYILSSFASCPPLAYPATTPCGYSGGDYEQGDYTAAQYVLNNHGSMPMVHWGGTPQSSGPGLLSTRTSKDPSYLFAASAGSDVRQAWDSLPMTQLASNDFYGGVQIGYSGGTGYANQTYFTSTGGGAGCTVQGIMTASGGVPNGIESLWGANAAGTTQGIGFGCVNPSNMPSIVLTSPTGTGVSFTVYPNNVCGTYTIASATSSTLSSTPCGDEYFIPFSQLAVPGNAPVLTWFINSLIDPPPNGRPLWAP